MKVVIVHLEPTAALLDFSQWELVATCIIILCFAAGFFVAVRS